MQIHYGYAMFYGNLGLKQTPSSLEGFFFLSLPKVVVLCRWPYLASFVMRVRVSARDLEKQDVRWFGGCCSSVHKKVG